MRPRNDPDDNDSVRGVLLPELPSTESGYWRWLIENELVVDDGTLLDETWPQHDYRSYLRLFEEDRAIGIVGEVGEPLDYPAWLMTQTDDYRRAHGVTQLRLVAASPEDSRRRYWADRRRSGGPVPMPPDTD